MRKEERKERYSCSIAEAMALSCHMTVAAQSGQAVGTDENPGSCWTEEEEWTAEVAKVPEGNDWNFRYCRYSSLMQRSRSSD